MAAFMSSDITTPSSTRSISISHFSTLHLHVSFSLPPYPVMPPRSPPTPFPTPPSVLPTPPITSPRPSLLTPSPSPLVMPPTALLAPLPTLPTTPPTGPPTVFPKPASPSPTVFPTPLPTPVTVLPMYFQLTVFSSVMRKKKGGGWERTDSTGRPSYGALDISFSKGASSLAHSTLHTLGCRTNSVVGVVHCTCRCLAYIVCHMFDWFPNTARQLVKPLAGVPSHPIDCAVYTSRRRISDSVQPPCGRTDSFVQSACGRVDTLADDPRLLLRC